MAATQEFLKPSATEPFFNRAFGFLVGMGIGPSYCYVLQVRGRKTGKSYSTPVNLMAMNGKHLLVAPWENTVGAQCRGHRADTLRRGSYNKSFRLKEVGGPDKLPILKEYLDPYPTAVQRYFTVRAGSPAEAFVETADRYPVFELIDST